MLEFPIASDCKVKLWKAVFRFAFLYFVAIQHYIAQLPYWTSCQQYLRQLCLKKLKYISFNSAPCILQIIPIASIFPAGSIMDEVFAMWNIHWASHRLKCDLIIFWKSVLQYAHSDIYQVPVITIKMLMTFVSWPQIKTGADINRCMNKIFIKSITEWSFDQLLSITENSWTEVAQSSSSASSSSSLCFYWISPSPAHCTHRHCRLIYYRVPM